MLLDVEDDPGWHNDENEDEGANKLLISLGGDTIVPIALELFPTFLADPKWKGIKPHWLWLSLSIWLLDLSREYMIKLLNEIALVALVIAYKFCSLLLFS